MPAPPRAERILVIRLGAVGDVVRTLPAVSALRASYPDARITWLVEPASSGILEGQPSIDAVLVFPRDRVRAALRAAHLLAAAREIRQIVTQLRRERFDLVIDFHSILKSGLLSIASGAPLRVAFAPPFGREGAWLFANARARVEPARGSRFARNDALVRFLAVPAPADARPLRVDPARRAELAAVLGGAPAALHCGTSPGTPHKRWSEASFARLAQGLRDAHGISSIVTSGPEAAERASAREVVRLSNGAAQEAPETRSLADLAALLASCRLFVSADTGPLHVASLVGIPVVQILGPTDPVENAPWDATPSRMVRAALPCSPCRRGCSAAACMVAVPPERVLAAASELLRGAAGGSERSVAAPPAHP